MYCFYIINIIYLPPGWLNRRVASTSMNRESSRSHAVFTVSLSSKVKRCLLMFLILIKNKNFCYTMMI